MGKVITNIESAFEHLEDGMTILAGGFGLCGIPEHSIAAIQARGTKRLTVVSNNCGVDDFGLGVLLQDKQVDKMISSYVGENKLFEEQFISGELDVELTPQGTLAEKLRAGGAGIPAFYTATGVGTEIAEGKETRVFNGREYVMEEAIQGDFAIVKADIADTAGNLIFNKTARNFNPLCAMAAKTTVVEVEKIVDVGEIDPNQVHLPGIYVDYIFEGENFEKRIEKRTLRGVRRMAELTPKEKILLRAGREIKSDMYINLGIGMPTLVANAMPESVENVYFQSENGLLGIGPYPTEDELDPDLINAGKETVTVAKGASYFDNAESFAMIRGGHIDLAILGGMEVSETGDLANYMIPGKLVKGMGGAMDLVVGAKKVVVIMFHTNKHGASKVKKQCDLPLTGAGVVSRLITDLAVFDFIDGQMRLVELQDGVTLEEVEDKTEAHFLNCLK